MAETDKYRDLSKKAAIEVMNIHVLTPNPAYSRADGVTQILWEPIFHFENLLYDIGQYW